jgi:hypothetical protein
MKPRYRVLQGPNRGIWYVYDNDTSERVKSLPTRKEARRVTIGMNAGWIPNEMEEKKSGDRTPSS